MNEVVKGQWRDRYLNKEITHAEYYQAYLKHGWYLELGGFTFESVAECIRAGDFYLNNIPLHLWDRRAMAYASDIARANRALNGESDWSLMEAVCALKEKARSDAIKIMRENGEIVTLPPEFQA